MTHQPQARPGYHSAPISSHAAQGRHPLQGTIQDQARQIAALEAKLSDQEQLIELYQAVYRNPPQQRAGVIEFPDRRPFPYTYRKEMTGANDATFGTAALASGKVKATFQLDAGKPTYLPRILFALLRTAHDAESATIPLNTYLPLGGLMPNGAKGLDFRWRASTSKGDLNWQSDWMDSVLFDLHKGYELPVESLFDQETTLTIEAESWGAADSGNNEAFSLYCSLITYKMRAVPK